MTPTVTTHDGWLVGSCFRQKEQEAQSSRGRRLPGEGEEQQGCLCGWTGELGRSRGTCGQRGPRGQNVAEA